MSDAGARGFAAEELLGPLNDFERKHAPKRLWAVGDVELLRTLPRVAIVGSRRASDAGLRRAHRLARELVEANVIVVSGLAEGVDTAAHRAAIDSGGRTIAVLGTPIDRCYPASNTNLQAEIACDHLVLSQFDPGGAVARKHFVLRNRTMALVANATVIVEAKEGSGTIHQAWEAIRLGRPLFIMKSILDDKDLRWPDHVLDYGARLLTDTIQIVDLLPSQRTHALEDAPF
jgi:DNA processing protein